MPDEVDRLLADVGKGGLVQVVDHVARDVVDPRHLAAVHLLRFEKLRLFRRDGDRLVIQLTGQQGCTPASLSDAALTP
ncbi:hypothetical protein D3C84_862430 [compost metagenome]